MTSQSLRELRAEVPAHLCIACEQPFPKHRTKTFKNVCRNPDCVRFYQTMYRIDQNAERLADVEENLKRVHAALSP